MGEGACNGPQWPRGRLWNGGYHGRVSRSSVNTSACARTKRRLCFLSSLIPLRHQGIYHVPNTTTLSTAVFKYREFYIIVFKSQDIEEKSKYHSRILFPFLGQGFMLFPPYAG